MPIRPLRPEELTEVEKVFGPGLDVTIVRVNEGSPIPNWIGRVGAIFRHTAAPTLNAITIVHTCYFPIELVTNQPQHANWLRDMGWLMHELTHAWQYQHVGIRYLLEAMTSPTYVYAPPGQSVDVALSGFSKAGRVFRDFNREQQGDIVRDYYFYLKQNADVSAWDPYLKALHEPPASRERPRQTSR